MLATGHVGPTIRIFDVTQPLSFAVFNRVCWSVMVLVHYGQVLLVKIAREVEKG